MQKSILNSIKSIVSLEFKTLRFNFFNVLLSILIVPLSFLVINVANSTSNLPLLLIGLIVSSLMGNFLINYSQRISNIVSIQVLELYSTWGVSTKTLALSIAIFHSLVAVPLVLIITIILIFLGISINWFLYITGLIISLIFLALSGAFMGSNIKNPNMALALNSYLYYILTMITPIYYPAPVSLKIYNIINKINPLSHIIEMLRYSVGLNSNINFISYIYILSLIIILFIVNNNRLKDVYMIESYI